MDLKFFAGLLLSGFLVCFFVYLFFKNYKKEVLNKATNWLALTGISYAFVFIFSFLWMIESFPYFERDYIIIYSAAVFLQTLILYKVFLVFSGKKNVLGFLLFYLAALLSFFFSPLRIFHFVLMISFLLTLILAINVFGIFVTNKRVAYSLMTYSLVSLVLEFLVFIGIGSEFYFSLISMLFFAVFLCFFSRDSVRMNKSASPIDLGRETPHILLFIKYFVYIIVMINLVLISTIAVHEFGHVAVAKYYGCESRTIAFEESSYPYSEVLCENTDNKFWIVLAGPLIPILIAIVLVFFGGLLKPISFLVIGFNILASYRDFMEAGVTKNLGLAANLLGVMCLIVGIVLLSRATTKELK